MAGELVSLPLVAGPGTWIAWFWSELEHDFTCHFVSSSIISTSVLCWCINLYHTHFWGCLCSSLRVFSTACCWIYIHDVKLSHLFVVYKISNCVMCFCLSYDCNVLAWKNGCLCGTSSFTLRNSKFVHYTQKCILCYWSVWYLLEHIWWHVQKYVHVAVTLIYTKKITLLLLSVILSALCHHKWQLTCNVSF